MMESTSAASSAFHNPEGPGAKGAAPRAASERHVNGSSNSGEHSRKQAPSGSSDASASRSGSSSRDQQGGSYRSSHSSSSSRTNYQQSQPSQSSSSSRGGSSSAASGNGQSNALPRRNSSNALGSSSRDRDRDRDYRSRGRSQSRDRGSSHHRDRSSNASSHQSSSSSHASQQHQYQFGASGNPVVRLRERNNILQMHRTGTRRANLSQADVATRVLGLDTAYMKVRPPSTQLCRMLSYDPQPCLALDRTRRTRTCRTNSVHRVSFRRT